MTAFYSRRFYETRQGGSSASADVIVPLLLSRFPAQSVVDVGCGIGLWLESFERHGVEDTLGIDGDYVDPNMLHIARTHFRDADLSRLTKLGRKFDIACSLEVAEHLPESCARQFVSLLTQAAPVVLFSAAIPHQGGTGHVNEQWQAYWGALFAAQGYVALDFIRPELDGNARVDWWYRQNTVVYCAPDFIPPDLVPVTSVRQLNYVDPEMIELLSDGSTDPRVAARAVLRDMRALGRAVRTTVLGRGPQQMGRKSAPIV